MKKIVLLAFVLVLLPLTAVVGFVRPVADSLPVDSIDSGKVIAQTNSTTTVYLDPPTINGTAIGVNNTILVNINIRDATDIYDWQAGLTFNPDVLECTNFTEGEFLLDRGETWWYSGTINNTAGVIIACGSTFIGDYKASGDGRLAYVNFTVIAPGFSDLHLSNVIVEDFNGNLVPANIIDVYTVIVDTTPHTVVTVSNSTGCEVDYDSGFYGHAFSLPAEKISFKVTGPYPGFSNVTIPKTLLNVSTLDGWRIAIDGMLLSTGERIITESATHYSIYFTYSAGIHYVQITTRALTGSTISITLSSTSITLGSNVTISGDIDPVRLGVIVTILHRGNVSGVISLWTTLATVTTDSNSQYSYTWMPETTGIVTRTYEVMAIWEGDDDTFGNVSDVQALTVLPIHVFEVPWDDKVFHVVTESNSTVSNFNFNQSLAQISFNVTGQEGTTGFCNITIPKTLMWVDTSDEWNVTINGTSLSTQETTVTFNGTHYSIYFTCRTSTVTIQVISKYVIPEFPTWTSILLMLIVLTVALAVHKRRLLKKPTH